MRSFVTAIRRIFRRDVFIPALVVRPGDDLVIAPAHLPASVDAVFLLNALHEQFPGVRLHLITGFPGIQVVRKPDCSECGRRGDQGRPDPTEEAQKHVRVAMPEFLKAIEQRPAVVARCFMGPGVSLSLIPPEQEGDAPKEFHVSARGDVGEFVFEEDCPSAPQGRV